MKTAYKGLSHSGGQIWKDGISDVMSYCPCEIENIEGSITDFLVLCGFEGSLKCITDLGYKNTDSEEGMPQWD